MSTRALQIFGGAITGDVAHEGVCHTRVESSRRKSGPKIDWKRKKLDSGVRRNDLRRGWSAGAKSHTPSRVLVPRTRATPLREGNLDSRFYRGFQNRRGFGLQEIEMWHTMACATHVSSRRDDSRDPGWFRSGRSWIPAYAGMTRLRGVTDGGYMCSIEVEAAESVVLL